MATELYIAPEWKGYNTVTGQFLKGHVPHNKGKKWSEWMDGRKAKKVKRIGMRNLHGRSDIGGWNAQPVFALDDEGNTVGWFASTYDAERKTGICSRNIRAVLEGKRKHAGEYRCVKAKR